MLQIGAACFHRLLPECYRLHRWKKQGIMTPRQHQAGGEARQAQRAALARALHGRPARHTVRSGRHVA